MDQFDRNLRQWVNEEQVGRGLTRRPMRPYGPSGALGLALAALLVVIMGTCDSEPGSVGGPSPSPQATVPAGPSSLEP